MRLLYRVIERQEPIRLGAEQYLTDWYGPHIPYNFPKVTDHLVWCVKNGIDEAEFKRDIREMYFIQENHNANLYMPPLRPRIHGNEAYGFLHCNMPQST